MKTPATATFRTIIGFALIAAAALVWSGCASHSAPAPAPHGDGKTMSPSPIKIKRQ